MDIILEVWDTFVADHVYAAVLPAKSAPLDFPEHGFSNGSVPRTFSTWQFEPATQYWTLEPFPAAYMTSVPRDNAIRQFLSLYAITCIFGFLLYFVFATLSFYFMFDHGTLKHPKFLKNQISLEIQQAMAAMPGMALCTAPVFLLEVQGFGKLYERTEDGPGRWYDFAQFPIFICFTDMCIYWIHRWLHLPAVYKRLHKPHHKWIMPTPYASHAFHPLDGFAQSLPYHIFPFIFPLHKLAYIALFVAVNFWSILIHDGEYLSNNPIVNGSACHTAHHLYFNYNYGQFLTFWDRLGGSYRKPSEAWFNKSTKGSQSTWTTDIKDMEKIQKEVEGEDDRSYDVPVSAKKNN